MNRHGGTEMRSAEKSQSKKFTQCVIPTICLSGKGKTVETVKRSVVAGGGSGGEGCIHEAQVNFRGVTRLYMINCNDGHITCTCQTHRTVKHKWGEKEVHENSLYFLYNFSVNLKL